MADGAHTSLYHGAAGALRESRRDDRGERHSGPVGMVQPLNIHAVSH